MHKALTMKQSISMGYSGYLDRAVCKPSRFCNGWAMPLAPLLTSKNERVTCKDCKRIIKQGRKMSSR